MAWIYEHKFLFIGTIFTPILIFSAILMSGGGHNELPFFLTFPWGMVGTLWGEPFSLLFLGLIQFPLYGYLLDRFLPVKRGISWILLAQHVALVALCVYMNG